MTAPREFRAGFLFCGLGAGARGFIEARASLAKDQARFINVGGVDNDPAACADFEYLTGTKATVADISTMTPEDMRAALGQTAPHCIFQSSPCKGFSRLLSTAASNSPKYQVMNRLVLQGFFLVCEAWPDPPDLLILENVPGIKSRGAELLAQIRTLLTSYGYVLHEDTHDCGEIGGLAQHRERFLMVARLPRKVSAYVYRPPRQRVKACGEVLQSLPVPGIGDDAGELHKLPRLSWINWVRLSLIPAGKDWRALPKDAGELSLKLAAANAASFKGRPGLMGVQDWSAPARTVNGTMKVSGGNSAAAVADPRVLRGPERFGHCDKVTEWTEPTGTVTHSPAPSSGAIAVADPRVLLPESPNRHESKYRVTPWQEPMHTVTGARPATSGGPSVADPRIPLEHEPRRGTFGVKGWEEPVDAVRGNMDVRQAPAAVADPRLFSPVPDGAEPRTVFARMDVRAWEQPARTVAGSGTNGGFAVADPRPASFGAKTHRNLYRVTEWEQPVGTVTGAVKPSSGAACVGDPRLTCKTLRNGFYGVMSWYEAAASVIGSARVDNSPAAVADPRGAPDHANGYPVIIAEDGTWHRPITTLELAVLQGLPPTVAGAPLKLAGRTVAKWRERIGNAVPVGAGRAIAESLLTALLAAALGTWTLGATDIWVRREDGATEYDFRHCTDTAPNT